MLSLPNIKDKRLDYSFRANIILTSYASHFWVEVVFLHVSVNVRTRQIKSYIHYVIQIMSV